MNHKQFYGYVLNRNEYQTFFAIKFITLQTIIGKIHNDLCTNNFKFISIQNKTGEFNQFKAILSFRT